VVSRVKLTVIDWVVPPGGISSGLTLRDELKPGAAEAVVNALSRALEVRSSSPGCNVTGPAVHGGGGEVLTGGDPLEKLSALVAKIEALPTTPGPALPIVKNQSRLMLRTALSAVESLLVVGSKGTVASSDRLIDRPTTAEQLVPLHDADASAGANSANADATRTNRPVPIATRHIQPSPRREPPSPPEYRRRRTPDSGRTNKLPTQPEHWWRCR
jgi:hypothetical protein